MLLLSKVSSGLMVFECMLSVCDLVYETLLRFLVRILYGLMNLGFDGGDASPCFGLYTCSDFWI